MSWAVTMAYNYHHQHSDRTSWSCMTRKHHISSTGLKCCGKESEVMGRCSHMQEKGCSDSATTNKNHPCSQ